MINRYSLRLLLTRLIPLAIVLCGHSFLGATSSGQPFSAEGTFAFESEYVFRGDYLDGPSLQPSLELSYDSAYAGIWTSQGLESDRGGVNELDYYVGYAWEAADPVTVDAGATVYHFPDAGGDSNFDYEPYVGLSLDTLLNPSLYAYYLEGDDPADGFYTVEAGLSHSFDLSKWMVDGLSFDIGVIAGSTEDFADNRYFYYGTTADLIYQLNEISDVSVGLRATEVDRRAVSRASLWWGTGITFHF